MKNYLISENSNLLNYVVVGEITLSSLLLSFLIILVTIFFRNILTEFIFTYLKRLASRTKIEYDDRALEALEKPAASFICALGVYFAILVLPVDPGIHHFAFLVFRGLSVFLIFWGLLRLIDVGADVLIDIAKKEGHSISAFIPLMKKALRAFVCIIGIIVICDNLGYSVGGILTTLGLGGPDKRTFWDV